MAASVNKISSKKSKGISRSNAARVQAKLSVGPRNDSYEREADHMADSYVKNSSGNQISAGSRGFAENRPLARMPAARPVSKISRLADTWSQRKEEEEVQPQFQLKEEEEVQPKRQRKKEEEIQPRLQRQEEEEVQPKKEPRANVRDKRKYPVLNKVENKLFSKKGQGEKLEDDTRSSLEVEMGADFKGVRVHTDGDAAEMSSELRAQAFTHDKDVFFNSGKFQPETVAGKHLLAHELTHVVQQGAAEQKIPEKIIDKNNAERQNLPPDPPDKKALAVAKETQQKKEEKKSAEGVNGSSQSVEKTGVKAKSDKDISLEDVVQEEGAKGPKKEREPTGKGKTKKTPGTFKIVSKKKETDKKTAAGGPVSKHLKQVSQARLDHKKRKIGILSAREKKTETPESKVQQSEKSVIPPVKEAQSRSNATQVNSVESTHPPQPDELAAKKQLENTLKSAVPTTLEEVDTFKEEGKGRVVGEAVKASVTADTQEVQGTYQKIEDSPAPQPAEMTPVDIPPREAAVKTAEINMGDGIVGDVLPEHTDLSEFEQESDSLMEKEGISQEQLDMVDEGELAEAKADKKALKSKVTEGPAEIKQVEETQKKEVKKELQKEEQQNKQKMKAKRQQALTGATDDQKKTKSKIETKRQQVTDHINAMYKTTSDEVKKKLDALEKKSLKAFDDAEKQATRDFENNVERRINAFKKRRYDRFGGSLLWAKDKLFGMDDLPEVKDIFESEKNNFVTRIDSLIKTISEENKRVIQECRDLIANAKKRIETFVSNLGPELQKTGQDALKTISSKLDNLNKEVNDKEKELQQKLEEKREAAIKAIEEKIEKMKEEMSGLVSKLGNLLLNAMVKFFKWALKKAGYASDKLMGIINKGKSVIKKIVTDPIGFISNIISAVKGGIGLFAKNIKKHLIGGLISWLTGAMADVPIQLPAQFDVKGIFSLVTQILGLTWDRIRKKLVKRLGERVVRIAETTVDIVKNLITKGPMALWEMIKAKAAEIKNQVIEGIRNWAIVSIVKQGIIKLVSFLNPAGAIVQAILAIYNTIMFFVENWSRIVDFVKSVFDSVTNIAMGRLSAASAFIERAMGMTIPIILNFLARLLGLSGIGKAVSKILKKIRKPIDKVVEKVIDKVVQLARKMFKKGSAAAGKIKDTLFGWLKIKKRFVDKAGKKHSLSFQGTSPKAPLVIKSAPQAVPDFIAKAKKDESDAAKRKKISQVEELYKEVAVQQRISQRNKKDASIQKQTETKINASLTKIHLLLPDLFSDADWGSKSNPLGIQWPKRASIEYDTLYFGPKTKRWISQERLKQARSSDAEKQRIKLELSPQESKAWEDNNLKIEDYKPHQLEALPDGGALLGISSEWHVYKGKKFTLKPGKTTGGGQLNRILKKYGFHPSKENAGKGLDADHVIEMQLGGKNLIRNLWPLDSSENRSSGSLISSMNLKNTKNNDDIHISEVKTRAKERPVWVEIQSVKSHS